MEVPYTAAELFRYADRKILEAAAQVWPRAQEIRLGAHTPSVTGYVRSLDVDGEEFFAKYSFLGLSLVSVVRGTCGSWEAVRAAQAAYTASRGALLGREAEQLKLLALARARVPEAVGYCAGVLFTRPLPGPTFGELVVKEPDRTEDLAVRAMRELDGAMRRMADRVQHVQISERGIPATFSRKFNGISGHAYLRQAGEFGPVLREVVVRLRRLGQATATGPRPLVYGDLKPEHIVYPHGPNEPPGYLDPGIAYGRDAADLAKLISRTTLGLIADPPPSGTVESVTAGLGACAGKRVWHLTDSERAAWLRELAVLWLMDTVNILSTYLTCPAVLPMPPKAIAAVERADAVCRLLDVASTVLAENKTSTAWPIVLGEAAKAAAS
ncbi:hypothetical protein [Streptomyces sp. NRRL B-1347]|uniref:hypothetical protein n=1 Tax=Streptomyces sp. NRRL B-1347 TaxID=1476877 RepID=UPI00068B32F6|nr:hypothetical protein [Streptomyces sp. NRRL B-1347]